MFGTTFELDSSNRQRVRHAMTDQFLLPVLVLLYKAVAIVIHQHIIAVELELNASAHSNPIYQPIGSTPAKDKYAEIRGTPFWRHYCGLSEPVFDAIYERLKDRIMEPRNIEFQYTRAQNVLRRRRPSKINVRNRLLNFLHQMKTGTHVHITFPINFYVIYDALQ